MKKIILWTLFVGLNMVFFSCQKEEFNDNCIPELKPDCICTRQYDPVCGCDDKTYTNACQAECNGILNYSPGPCNQ